MCEFFKIAGVEKSPQNLDSSTKIHVFRYIRFTPKGCDFWRAHKYTGGLSPQIQSLIEEKRASGRKRKKEAKAFRETDVFHAGRGAAAPVPARDIVEKRAGKRPNESGKSAPAVKPYKTACVMPSALPARGVLSGPQNLLGRRQAHCAIYFYQSGNRRLRCLFQRHETG